MNCRAVPNMVVGRIQDSRVVEQRFLEKDRCVMTVCAVGELMAKALKDGYKVLFFGYGGSAAHAQQMAAELAEGFLEERPRLAALALTVNLSSITAIANDYSYRQVFARQLQGPASSGEVAVGISTSGNSENILRALRSRKIKGLVTVGFVGETGGKLRDIADYCLCVLSTETPRIQELHMLIDHLICEIVEVEHFTVPQNLLDVIMAPSEWIKLAALVELMMLGCALFR